MGNSLNKLEEITKSALALVDQNRKLLAKSDSLEEEVKGLKIRLEAEVLKNDDLLNKIKIIKLAKNIGSPDMADTDMKELKRKINEYIKEIDHCLTMLND